MIAFKVSVIGGPILLIVSGCLGESGIQLICSAAIFLRHCWVFKGWCIRTPFVLFGNDLLSKDQMAKQGAC